MRAPFQTASTREYTLRDLLTVVFKRRKTIGGFFLATMSGVVLLTFLVPPTYEVSAAIVLKKTRSDVSMKDAPATVTEEEVNSETQLLQSRPLLEEVLKTLGVGNDEAPKNDLQRAMAALYERLRGYRLSPFERRVLELQRHVRITPVRKSNVVEISYRSPDPAWATDVVRTLTEKHLELRSRVYQPPQAAAFFDEQVGRAKGRLRDREKELQDFVQHADVTVIKGPAGTESLAAQKTAGLEQLSELQRQLAETSAAVHEYEQTIASLEERLTREPERLPSANRLNLDPAREEIEKELVGLELRRDELIQKYTPDNRLVHEVETRIALAQERLAQLQQQTGGIDRTEPNPVYQELRTDMLRARANREGARARRDSLAGQIAAIRHAGERMNVTSLELERLRRELNTAEEAYNLYQQKSEEARISTAMDHEKILSVSVARPATRPLRPVLPNKRLNLALGLFLAVVGGLGLAFGLEYLDHTFTSGLDVERRLGIPVLASIPEERPV